ncbi:BRCA1 C Terminus (BRCT) domain-containing protein [Cardiosporidium cionae]|uniref:Pescadillo homolog n=1 Tax=Cardiosporidium cionae TaxID=476202 RepID=A0ABQ7JEV7_9APIC|nr:BRCA1 C Terminus (BRCT) domain-containing protein [Cardiosporidium cionae]|eukprot:KAF8822506.1 BRCA1 C Terminus (BRCT) domain-containing protein [Cardiosporidium cionae]
MARELKKGKKGPSAQYVTRNMALRKLQISLAEFRRLCIFKGIYPRDPQKKRAGKNKIYYHMKDIQFMAHEPLLNAFRDNKAFVKKYNKSIAKREYKDAKALLKNKPQYSLHHIVKERFPTLHEALVNMDDCLSTVAIFTSLPINIGKGVSSKVVEECSQLMDQFHHFIARKCSLRKVFISIKGYYFEAEIMGEKILWLLPHQFVQTYPSEVDFRVLQSFGEFYRTQLKFVNFKLYSLENYRYPPTVNKSLQSMGYGFLSLISGDLVANEKKGGPSNSHSLNDTDVMPSATEFANNPLVQEMQEKLVENDLLKHLFAGSVFLVSREVTLSPISLIILSGGGQVTWQGEGAPLEESNPSITHQIVDRPLEHFKRRIDVLREYVQPQWVFDSFNCRVLLPIEDYAVGKTLPPHLSPFVDDKEEGYMPKQREHLNALIEQKQKQLVALPSPTNTDDAVGLNEDKVEGDTLDSIEQQHFEDLTKEFQNESFEPQKPTKITKASKHVEKAPSEKKVLSTLASNIELQKSMLSKKHKRLLERIDFGKERKLKIAENLLSKRTAIEKGFGKSKNESKKKQRQVKN